MASHSVKEILDADGNPILAEVARRDTTGALITSKYASLTGANTFTQNNTFTGKVVLSGSSGAKGIQFGSINYQITNMEAGSVTLTLPKPMGGERPNAQITLKQPNFGNGTWRFYIGILGDEAESVSFAMNTLSSTGFKISIRRQIDISSRTDLPTNVPYTLHWLAVKYY